MKIIVDNNIRVVDATPQIKDYFRGMLTLDNPDYYKKERLGKWTGNTPKEIVLYTIDGDDLVLPFGCFNVLWDIHPVKDDYTLLISPIQPLKYESNINLYPYQENAVKAVIGAKNGVLVMPCGAGKTQCGLEIISRIGGRALWLTHTQDLLNQSKTRANAVLSNIGVGSITAGKVNIGTHITFATVQTLSKLDLSQLKDTWDIVIVDEAQHCCGSPTRVTQFYKVVNSLSARYKIGLTATPKRADGLENAMFSLLGGKIYEVTRDEVKHTTCPIKVDVIPTGWMPDYNLVLMGDGTIDYSKLIENMINDEGRFDCVLATIGGLKWTGGIIVLANRVEYLQRLCKAYNDGLFGDAICLSGMGTSKKAKAERREALERLNAGELDCIFATYQLAKEGLDVPNLRYVVMATPEKDETTVVQSVGRVERKAPGKEYGTVIDFLDDFGMYQGWAKKRMNFYKKMGADVVEV